jgi:hypothetical protein
MLKNLINAFSCNSPSKVVYYKIGEYIIAYAAKTDSTEAVLQLRLRLPSILCGITTYSIGIKLLKEKCTKRKIMYKSKREAYYEQEESIGDLPGTCGRSPVPDGLFRRICAPGRLHAKRQLASGRRGI